MARMIFPNLAVKDLERSKAFFGELGFEFDARFTDDTATAMVVSEQAVVMLLQKEKFKEFTTKELVDPTKQTEVIIALSADSREDVDTFADKALAPAAPPPTSRWRWTSCTRVASTTRTATPGRSSG